MENRKKRLDAGLASHNHYKTRMPRWRYQFRQLLLPIVRWETPYVAFVQERMRNPALDSYFAMTANLGTHTAFLVLLPILFWCGYMSLARGMLHILAAGVYLSGIVKDLLCLPRPLSPPLTRITMSGSAALEYGFPSTHSTNAVSVVYYALYTLKNNDSNMSPQTRLAIEAGLYIYMVSIVLGRVYCGMHGFFDVILGGFLGAFISAVQSHYGPAFDTWLYSCRHSELLFLVLVLLLLVGIHPEPADDCPCFDDSVAFVGVMIGIELASWRFAKSSIAWNSPPNIPFDLDQIGLPIAVLRLLLGVVVIFAWRASMKPLLLTILPPVFRIIESIGLDSPRRFFIRASQYTYVPTQRNSDNVIPSASDIPKFLSDLRQRRRAISVGPQSEADVYENLAYRETQRRDSTNRSRPITPIAEGHAQNGYFDTVETAKKTSDNQGRKRSKSIDQLRREMGADLRADMLTPSVLQTPSTPARLAVPNSNADDAVQEALLFARVHKPRVRYDVEVVTKLIVYAGIAWLTAEGNPRLFHSIGWSV